MRTRVGWLLAVLLPVSAAAGPADFRFAFTPGQGFRYHVYQRSEPSAGPRLVEGRTVYAFEPLSRDRLYTRISGNGRVDDEVEELVGLRASFNLSPLGPSLDEATRELITLPNEPEAGSLVWSALQAAPAFFPVLDAAAMTRGDTWSVRAPIQSLELDTDMSFHTLPALTRCRLDGVETVGGLELIRLQLTTTATLDERISGVDLRGHLESSGLALLDPGRGRAVYFRSEGTFRVEVRSGGIGGAIARGKIEDSRNGGVTKTYLEVVDEALFPLLGERLRYLEAPEKSPETPGYDALVVR